MSRDMEQEQYVRHRLPYHGASSHMNATVKFIRPSFIHACIYIYSTFIYIYIDTLSHPLSFVLYYCTSTESTLVAYCISSTVLHRLSLQVVFGVHTYRAT